MTTSQEQINSVFENKIKLGLFRNLEIFKIWVSWLFKVSLHAGQPRQPQKTGLVQDSNELKARSEHKPQALHLPQHWWYRPLASSTRPVFINRDSSLANFLAGLCRSISWAAFWNIHTPENTGELFSLGSSRPKVQTGHSRHSASDWDARTASAEPGPRPTSADSHQRPTSCQASSHGTRLPIYPSIVRYQTFPKYLTSSWKLRRNTRACTGWPLQIQAETHTHWPRIQIPVESGWTITAKKKKKILIQ